MIVVTTPTGSIGRQVLQNLLGHSEPIRVIARDPSRLPQEMSRRIEIVRGSHGDSDAVDRAFVGADAVFWVAPPNFQALSVEGAFLDFSQPACEAFRRHGVKRVVGVSALGRGTELGRRAGLVSASLAMDERIAAAGVAYRALACPSFMDNILRQVDSIRDRGEFIGPIRADHKIPTCATRDIASAATELLLDSSWAGVEDVPLLGPEDLSFNEMAATISEVLGRTIRYSQVTLETFRASLLVRGTSAAFAQAYVDMVVAKNGGLDNAVERTAQSSTSMSFRQWCEEVLKPTLADSPRSLA